MKSFLTLALAAVCFVPLSPVIAAPPAKDWTQVAARTPSGSFIQGNPNAPVKLVEYLSLTCPHCAHLESTAGQLGPKYVKTGLVSYEVRLALRDAFDLLAATLARCAGPRGFFAVKPALYAAQDEWLQKASSWSATTPDLSKMSPADSSKAAAKGAGLDVFFAKHGLPAARANICLADEGERTLLAKNASAIWDIPGFPGTPAFLINGVMTPPIAEWTDLDKALAAAVAKSGHK